MVSCQFQLQVENGLLTTNNWQRFEEFSGDFVDRVTPVPIPNTEVKPVGADGTARVTVWESRKSPGLFKKARLINFKRAFLCVPSMFDSLGGESPLPNLIEKGRRNPRL